ncbi:hypothetical protein [Enterovirga sp. CN4-39]|uniref:hypothetical protein n=1 Tax=Enterovirga sp. CN4-39 TaxID=3400910 RepID=UPI003C0FDFEA
MSFLEQRRAVVAAIAAALGLEPNVSPPGTKDRPHFAASNGGHRLASWQGNPRKRERVAPGLVDDMPVADEPGARQTFRHRGSACRQ